MGILCIHENYYSTPLPPFELRGENVIDNFGTTGIFDRLWIFFQIQLENIILFF